MDDDFVFCPQCFNQMDEERTEDQIIYTCPQCKMKLKFDREGKEEDEKE